MSRTSGDFDVFRMASQMLGRVMQQAEPESCTQASRGTESSTLFPTPPLSSKNPRRESTSESGEAAQQQPFLRTPSSGLSFSRTSSESSASTTSKPILRITLPPPAGRPFRAHLQAPQHRPSLRCLTGHSRGQLLVYSGKVCQGLDTGPR